MDQTHFSQHPLSAAFPAMSGHEIDALAADIKANGQREPAIIFEGQILDGWHRYRACEMAHVSFKTVELAPFEDPVALVKSRNLHRRHLTESQRAAAVVACSNWTSSGRPAKPGTGARLTETNAQLAKEADVSERTIKNAKAAHSGGLGNAVKEGKVTAKRAAEIVKADPKIAKKIASGKVTEAKAFEKPKSKILPRKVPVEKPALKTDPKQSARIAELEIENADLRRELKESRENANELGESLHAFVSADEGTAAAAKEIKRLLGVVRVVEATRDQYMTKCNELVKSVKSLQRRLEKCEGKKP